MYAENYTTRRPFPSSVAERMHRLHLIEQRKLRQQQQQQRELSGSQQLQEEESQQQPQNRVLHGSQQQQQNRILDGAALVRLLNGDLSQPESTSKQQQQLRPQEQEHRQQEQEQEHERVSGEDPVEALDDAKTRYSTLFRVFLREF